MDEKRKAAIIEELKLFPKGSIGALTTTIENAFSYVPVPFICVVMAMEIAVESAVRDAIKLKIEGYDLKGSLEDIKVIREYIRSLSDEEINSFFSKENLEEAIKKSLEYKNKYIKLPDSNDPDKGSMLN